VSNSRFQKYLSIGDLNSDSEAEVLKHRFLIYLGSLMSIGGLIWGGICLYYEAYIPATIPLGYSVITPINFFFFARTKNFVAARFVQTLISLLLPFLFQWSLGGYLDSGAMMFWAILSVIGCLGYYDTRSSRIWITGFVLLTLASYWGDAFFHEHFSLNPPAEIQVFFLAVNTTIIPIGIYLMVVLFINIRDTANVQLEEKHKELQRSQSQLVQSEKLAALGQLIAGVAHEVNTPLGAIQASIGTIRNSISNTIKEFPEVVDQLDEEQRQLHFELLDEAIKSQKKLYSSKEIRAQKRALRTELEETDLKNPHDIADTLVDIGIYELDPRFKPIFERANWEDSLKLLYGLVEQIRNSDNIQIAVERASKIVFALKNYSRFDSSSNKTSAKVETGIETVLTLYQNHLKKGIEVERNYGDTPAIDCFEDELNQVWTNLIHNAIHVLGMKGKITIETEQKGKSVIVKIIDNGPGIPEELQEKIFEPFFTTKPAGEGSGLGLDIVRGIVQKHEGKIQLESKPGRTCFTVVLPILKS